MNGGCWWATSYEAKNIAFSFHFYSILHVLLLPTGVSAAGEKVMWSSNQLSSHTVANFNSDSLNSFPLCYCFFSYQFLRSDCYYQSLCSSDETLSPDERSDPKMPAGRTNDVISGQITATKPGQRSSLETSVSQAQCDVADSLMAWSIGGFVCSQAPVTSRTLKTPKTFQRLRGLHYLPLSSTLSITWCFSSCSLFLFVHSPGECVPFPPLLLRLLPINNTETKQQATSVSHQAWT